MYKKLITVTQFMLADIFMVVLACLVSLMGSFFDKDPYLKSFLVTRLNN